jgi:nondiscriminating glutamyl-tRNA synthetase
MNGQYMAAIDEARLLDLITPALLAEGLTDEEELVDRRDWFLQLLSLLKIRARLVGEVVPQARVFLSPLEAYDEDAVAKHWKDPDAVRERFDALADSLREVEPWEPGPIETALRATAEGLGIGFGKLIHPFRIALTGGSASPGIDQVVYLLGRDEVLRRLRSATQRLTAGTREEEAR